MYKIENIIDIQRLTNNKLNELINKYSGSIKDLITRYTQFDLYTSQYGTNIEKKLKCIDKELKDEELKFIRLQLRLEKILELINNKTESKPNGKQIISTSNIPSNKPPNEQKICNKNIQKSDSNNKSNNIDKYISHSSKETISKKEDIEQDKSISVHISCDESIRSLINEYFNGNSRNNKDESIDISSKYYKGANIEDKSQITRTKIRQKKDNIRRTLRPLNKPNDNSKSKCYKYWEYIKNCFGLKKEDKTCNYLHLTNQQWDNFINAIHTKKQVPESDSIEDLGIENLQPIVVEYDSIIKPDK
ncbi:uncharacterized protein CMU_005920 [Cryptosporidium muris RN66]|uniref:Uncharacterized protein n=1 Tax=Cryptosporidium muris (strain RN66) TaxID=441375 RepID=B6AHH4_CRYMR|nr:uncharacterized protein CMU_005920 [Cryptosporidium muris RN66]EEA07669.1 hypothetical protein, conserved [Cryptosporidium muris RN66]|eukprot:XP_002142018.1 hypothetical protein [Cryptosporidium muris RN66]